MIIEKDNAFQFIEFDEKAQYPQKVDKFGRTFTVLPRHTINYVYPILHKFLTQNAPSINPQKRINIYSRIGCDLIQLDGVEHLIPFMYADFCSSGDTTDIYQYDYLEATQFSVRLRVFENYENSIDPEDFFEDGILHPMKIIAYDFGQSDKLTSEKLSAIVSDYHDPY